MRTAPPGPGMDASARPALGPKASHRPSVSAGERAKPGKFRRRVAAILGGLLVTLLIAELVLRTAGARLASPRLPLSYSVEAIDTAANGETFIKFDPDLGWVSTPSIDWARGEVHYRINPDGMRSDRIYSRLPSPGVRRFAAYGDSFTHCDDYDVETCWTTRLEEMLPNTEVLPWGVPGYSADQAWLRYEQTGASWRPCAVLIGHMVENVNRMVNRFRPFYDAGAGIPLSKPRYLLQGGRLTLLPNPARDPNQLKDPGWVEANLGPHDDWYFPGTFVANPLDFLELVRLARSARYRQLRAEDVNWTSSRAKRMYQPDGEAFNVSVEVLAGFASQVRADGATPVVLVFPFKGEINAQAEGWAKPHQALLDALKARDIPTIDLTDALGEAARRTNQGLLLSEYHYKPAGNAVVARALANQLPRPTSETCGR